MSARAGRSWAVWLAGAWVPALLLLGALPLASRLTGEPLSLFTRDVFSVGEIPVYAAFVSTVGAFLWCVTATVCLFTGTALPLGPGARRFYVGFGIFTLLLLGDDFFMLHEWIVPKMTGLPEETVSVLYAAILGGLLVATRREIVAREPAFLGAALAAFAASVGMDTIERIPAPAWHYLLEEGFKFLGITAWTAYFVRACRRETMRVARGNDG